MFKNLNKIDLIIIGMCFTFLTFCFTGCSGLKPRTRYSDPALRVAINPDGIDENSYSRLQYALVQSGKYFVVDRGRAFLAALNEQNISRIQHPGRFADAEKYARLRKLFGIGGIIQAHLHCHNSTSFWSGETTFCVQALSIVDTSTGEVIASAELEVPVAHAKYIADRSSPSWEDAVSQLNNNFPEKFIPIEYTPEMLEMRRQMAEEGQRGE